MGIRTVLLCLAVLTAAASAGASAGASTYLEVGDETYGILSRLEAEGVVRSGLLATKPMSRKEAARLLREAEMNSEGRSEFIKDLVRELKERIKPEEENVQPLDSVYAEYVHTNDGVRVLAYGAARQKEQAFNYNNDGELYSRGSSTHAGFTSRLEDLGPFSFFLNPEYRSSGGGGDLTIKSGYVVLDPGFDLIVGKESQWWGPGQNGALLLSNNAEPFALARITNPVPIKLPWVLEHLGPIRITFFAAKLEEDRADIPEPYLWGTRFDLKPLENMEIGLQRTALLGGRGRENGLGAWGRSFIASDAHDPGEAGDQRVGYDITLTLPFSVQPVQLYTEGAAEDSVHLPNQWAYLYGLYLPRLLDAGRLELRVEWAETYDRHETSTWYLHHVYTTGYTYKGMVIGHHMGTNARDTFAELTYRVPERNALVSLFLEVMEHNISNPVREKDLSAGLRGVAALSGSVELEFLSAWGRTRNPGNERTGTMDARELSGTVRYRF